MGNKTRHEQIAEAICNIRMALDLYTGCSFSYQVDDKNIFSLWENIKAEQLNILHATGSVDNEEYDLVELLKKLPAGHQLIRQTDEGYYVAKFIKDFGITHHIEPVSGIEKDPRITLIKFLATQILNSNS